jgi:hypothetical protein
MKPQLNKSPEQVRASRRGFLTTAPAPASPVGVRGPRGRGRRGAPPGRVGAGYPAEV